MNLLVHIYKSLGLYKSTLGQHKFQYFVNLFSIEQSDENVLDNDLFIYINHMKNSLEVFKAQSKDLLNMEIPEWIISPFDIEVKSENFSPFLKKNLLI